ncbi:MAG: DNA methyltransferase [Armatimonadota bacterium]|nr:DNA methyltransferase [Armatimonadota bacterium]
MGTPTQDNNLHDFLATFSAFGKRAVVRQTHGVPTYVNEFWTSKQRQANSLHEIAYRACFKPQLPRFFIDLFTQPGDVVYDPFMGRGTTVLESALLERTPFGCDVNPLSDMLTRPRLNPPRLPQIAHRLHEIDLSQCRDYPAELEVFYHPDTLVEICALREYLLERERAGVLDEVDRWIRMVAVNRLTGHSKGFFSVYTLPPNQAVSVESQRKINERLGQTPPRRDVRECILRKSKSLLHDCSEAVRLKLASVYSRALLLTRQAHDTPEIPDGSVSLVVTSPPFLDVVDYAQDNWLRCWFCGIDPHSVPITMARSVEEWREAMRQVFNELARVLRRGGWIAFEVGEVRGGQVLLEEVVIDAVCGLPLAPEAIVINDQHFTKTAHIWGVSNRVKGTNTNRIVLLQRR